MYDLDTRESLHALRRLRRDVVGKQPMDSPEILQETLDITGGRLSFLSRVAKSKDTVVAAKKLLRAEQNWILSQIGLIPDCDDDVMDEVCDWLVKLSFTPLLFLLIFFPA